MPNDIDPQMKKQTVLSLSVGVGLTKTGNLKPLQYQTIQDLEDIVHRHALAISSIIKDGVRTRKDYAKLSSSLRKDVKSAGSYLISGTTTTGGRKIIDLDTCGVALLDFDKGNYQMSTLQDLLQAWQFYAWETINSKPGNRKWRVLLPLAAPLNTAQYEKAYAKWVSAQPFGSDVDLSQGRPTQPALLPVIWEGTQALMFGNRHGEVLDLFNFLSQQDKDLLAPIAPTPFENYVPPVEGLTPGRIQEVLAELDPAPEDIWIRVGRALHHQFGGSDDGLNIWMEWASGCPHKFAPHEHVRKWTQLHVVPATSKPVTWRSLERMVSDQHRGTALQHWAGVIERCETVEQIKDETAKGIRDDTRLTMEDVKELGTYAKHRAAALGYKDWSVSHWRDHFDMNSIPWEAEPSEPEVEVSEDEPEETRKFPPHLNQRMPAIIERNKHWYFEWMYLTDSNRFLRVKTGEVMKDIAVNRLLNAFLLNEKRRPVMHATELLTDVYRIPKAHSVARVPHEAELFTGTDGMVYANLWRPESLPAGWDHDKEANSLPTYSRRQRVAIFRFLRHVCNLLEPEDRRHLIRYIAWVVQNEGRKARWAPIIYSVQGTGKSIMGRVIRAMLGRQSMKAFMNTDEVEGHHIVSSDFNSWADGKTFCVIEELKQPGERANSFTVSNRLKAVMSNDLLSINEKFMPLRTVPNITNYICFTNSYHPISIESAKERRWLMLASPMTVHDTGALDRVERRDGGEYFSRLAELADDREMALGLRRWFFNHTATYGMADWSCQGKAPKTEWFYQIAELSSAGTAHGNLSNLLGQDWVGNHVPEGWFSVTGLRDHVRTTGFDGEHDDRRVLGHTSTMTAAFMEQGYVKLPEGRVKIDSVYHTIYIHKRLIHAQGWYKMIKDNTTSDEQAVERIRRHIRTRWRRQQDDARRGSVENDFVRGNGEEENPSP